MAKKLFISYSHADDDLLDRFHKHLAQLTREGTISDDLKLGRDCPEIAPGLRVPFSRWAFQFGEGDQAQFHWIDAETVK